MALGRIAAAEGLRAVRVRSSSCSCAHKHCCQSRGQTPSMQLTQGLHRSLQAAPDRTATIFRARERTFQEHADRVARLAAGLCALGVGDGDRVGMLAFNSDCYAEYLLAVPWAGGVLNPVNIRWNTYLQKLFAAEGLAVAGWVRSRRLDRSRRDFENARLRGGCVSAAYGVSPTEYREGFRA